MKTLPHVRRARRNSPIFFNWPPKNIPDQQKRVAFRKSQKVLNHSILLGRWSEGIQIIIVGTPPPSDSTKMTEMKNKCISFTAVLFAFKKVHSIWLVYMLTLSQHRKTTQPKVSSFFLLQIVQHFIYSHMELDQLEFHRPFQTRCLYVTTTDIFLLYCTSRMEIQSLTFTSHLPRILCS